MPCLHPGYGCAASSSIVWPPRPTTVRSATPSTAFHSQIGDNPKSRSRAGRVSPPQGRGKAEDTSRPDLLGFAPPGAGPLCASGPCHFQPIRHTIPALASSQRGGDAAARPRVRREGRLSVGGLDHDRADVLDCPGCRSGRLPHCLPRIFSQEGLSATCNVLLTETDSRPATPRVTRRRRSRSVVSRGRRHRRRRQGRVPTTPLGRRDPTAEGEVTRGGTPQPHNPTPLTCGCGGYATAGMERAVGRAGCSPTNSVSSSGLAPSVTTLSR